MGKYKRTSPMQVKFWLDKGLSEEEAKYKIRSFRKINIEYWLERGFSNAESISKVKEFQKEQSLKLIKKRKENQDDYKKYQNTNIEFYLDKGYSLEESFEKLKERQTTFSLDKCIEKYGKELGLEKWKKRQNLWQKKLYDDKSIEEIQEMHRKRDCVSIDNFIRRGYDLDEAKEKNREAVIKRMNSLGRASKESLEIFLPLYKELLQRGYSELDIFFGYKEKNEWYIYSNTDKKIFMYDFTIRSKKLIIEYQGSKFHYNESIHTKDWRCLYSNISPEESIKLDETKRKLAEKNGFNVIYIWDFENKNDVIEKILKQI